MNVLFLVPRSIYDTKMSRVRFEEIESLVRLSPNVDVKTSGPGWDDWPAGMEPMEYLNQEIASRKLDASRALHVVVSYMVTGLAASPVPVAVIFHETYNYPKTMQLIEDTGAKVVVFTYSNDVALYQAPLEAAGRALWVIPHSADEYIYRDYGLEKDIDVLVVGNLSEQFYPFRHRLARLAHRELRKRGYRVVQLPHPGFELPPREGAVVGEAYARYLNRSKVVLTCTSRQRYAFAKLVEIPLCASLPVSDLPRERQGFFRQTTLNVEQWMLDREILAKVEDVLDDDGLRARLTAVAHDKVAQRLQMRHWAERFIYCVRRGIWGESPEPPTAPVGDDDK